MNRAERRRRELADKQARRALTLALEYHNAGRLTRAEAIYRRILKSDPDQPFALHMLGVLAHQTGDTERAVDLIGKALIGKPDFPEAHNNLGYMLNDLGRFDEAVASYRSALDLIADYPEAHNNLGIALMGLGRIDEAVAHYHEAIALRPDYGEAHNNLGNAQRDLGRPDDAVVSFENAIALRPEFAETHNNLGNALKDLGRLDEALASYRKALARNADYAEAHNNLGNVQRELGHLEDAVASYTRAITVTPGFAAAHDNLGNGLLELGRLDGALEHLLKAIELNPDSQSNLDVLLKAARGVDSGKVIEKLRSLTPDSPEPELLAYSLASFSPDQRAEDSYHRVVDKLPAMTTETLSFEKPSNPARPLPAKTVALMQWGRSGTGFLHSLFDGHPQVSTLPGHYLGEFFGREVWQTLPALKRRDVIANFSRMYDVLFDANSARPLPGETLKDIREAGISEGYTAMGADRNQPLTLDREKFSGHFDDLLAGCETASRGDLFKMAHLAFEETLGRGAAQELIFYHLHNPDNYALANYLRHFPQSKLLMAVREPVQSCESWLSSNIGKTASYPVISRSLVECLFKFDQVPLRLHDSRGVRLEDIKLKPRETMASLCQWLEIDDHEALYSPTFQGLSWWGDPSTVKFGRTKPTTGFGLDQTDRDADPIKRKVGYLFSDQDQFILATLFYPVRVLYGYQEQDDSAFARNLKKIRPALDEPFDFEKESVEETRENAHYRYLRRALVDRWRTLDSQGTYPGMVTPLAVP